MTYKVCDVLFLSIKYCGAAFFSQVGEFSVFIWNLFYYWSFYKYGTFIIFVLDTDG